MNSDWQRQAACRGIEPDEADAIFFPTSQGHPHDYAEALSFCDRCPVKDECAAAAIDAERGQALSSRFGMFGGLTPRERWARSRDAVVGDSRPKPGVTHGTVSGYRRHGCHCDACAAAYTGPYQKYCCQDHGTHARNATNNPKRRAA